MGNLTIKQAAERSKKNPGALSLIGNEAPW